MKKLLLIAAAVAGMSVAASCQKEAPAAGNSGDVTVSISVEVPNVLETKAIAKAENADIVYYEVWTADWKKQLYPVDNTKLASEPVVDKKATVELTLVAGQTYNFIFWAQKETCGAYDVNELKKVKVDYNVIANAGNSDVFDAYYDVETITVNGPINQTITLFRPFAQLNFGASRMDSDLGNITVGETEVTVTGLATVFNTIDGLGETEYAGAVTFKATGLAADPNVEKLVTNNSEYTWVAMDYMLMMDDKTNVTVTAAFEVEEIGVVNHNISSVPLQKNYRTNIVGDLFTTDAKLQIVIDPAFEEPDYIIGVGTPVDNKVSLQESINKAASGDVLILADGVYEGVTLIEDKSLTLVAANPGKAVIKGKLGVAYQPVTLKGLAFEVTSDTAVNTGHQYVDNANYYIIPIYCADVTVEDCVFTGMTDDFGAIYYYANTSGATTENLEKLTVKNSSFDGGRAIRSRANVEVTGCEFTGLINPCLQILGFANDALKSKVIFTGNTSDNAVNGVTIKTTNYKISNVDFNVGGNTNCNTIAYDTKKVSNMNPSTFTYSGEVTTMIVEP
ncbi:MAG: hypothetical protein J6A22_03615 [Bacteroidales bacterium]|nr:hypothetical protein [Bacteroidales bacterium]